jgi:two-component system, NarL family, nitrate/nitrite response regulator NarL
MKSIVLIDDIPVANFIMKKMISLLAQDTFTITDFTSSAEALENLPSIHPDLIFLDLNMPDMNGYEFLTALEERNINYPVIILSSSTSQVDKEKASGYKNVKGYFSKPLEKETLSKILSEL